MAGIDANAQIGALSKMEQSEFVQAARRVLEAQSYQRGQEINACGAGRAVREILKGLLVGEGTFEERVGPLIVEFDRD